MGRYRHRVTGVIVNVGDDLAGRLDDGFVTVDGAAPDTADDQPADAAGGERSTGEQPAGRRRR